MTAHPSATLGELCAVSIGRTPRRDKPRFWSGANPWATVRELSGGKLSATKEGITDAAVREVMPPPVKAGTLLFSFKLSIGKIAFAAVPMHHNEAIAALPIRDPSVLDPGFLFYALRAQTYDAGASHAVLGKVLNKKKVEQIAIPLPPLDEQRRIVDILNRAASIERLRARAASHLRDLIPALFIKMFGDPIDNPMGWDVKPLGELLSQKPNYGTMVKPSAEHGAWLDLRVANLTSAGLDLKSKKWVDLPPKDVQRHSVQDGDIVLARAIGSRDHLGKCDVVYPREARWALDSHLMRVRCDPQTLSPEFLVALLRTPRGRDLFLKNTRNSAVQFNINAKEFCALQIPTPPLAHQCVFAEMARRAQGTMELLEDAATSAGALGRSLMARLFDPSTPETDADAGRASDAA